MASHFYDSAIPWKKLKIDVETRWNSNDIIESVLVSEKAIIQMLIADIV